MYYNVQKLTNHVKTSEQHTEKTGFQIYGIYKTVAKIENLKYLFEFTKTYKTAEND